MPATATEIRTVTGEDIAACIGDVARVRMAVFRDWPYLYEGDIGYERDYLAAYAVSPHGVVVLACAGGEVVGASTGIPLDEAGAAFRAPFEARGIDPARVFYCGESVLLPRYRGRGIGHAFFDRREAHARSLGRIDIIAFCAVDRAADDPRRPEGERGNEAFWQRRGYVRQPGMTVQLAWDEIGVGECTHELTFWVRPSAVEGDPA